MLWIKRWRLADRNAPGEAWSEARTLERLVPGEERGILVVWLFVAFQHGDYLLKLWPPIWVGWPTLVDEMGECLWARSGQRWPCILEKKIIIKTCSGTSYSKHARLHIRMDFAKILSELICVYSEEKYTCSAVLVPVFRIVSVSDTQCPCQRNIITAADFL